MKHHSVLWYLIVDAIADFRAWLQQIYGNMGQQIEQDENEARLNARNKHCEKSNNIRTKGLIS